MMNSIIGKDVLAFCQALYHILICCYIMAKKLLAIIGALIAGGLGTVIATGILAQKYVRKILLGSVQSIFTTQVHIY